MSDATMTREPAKEAAASAPGRRAAPVILRKSWTVGAFAVLFAVYGFWLGTRFLNVDDRMLDVHQQIPILVLGLSVVVVLIAGQFDLSVASMATLTTFLAVGLRIKEGLPMWLVLVICLAIGVTGGLINGFMVVKVRVNAFIATLATGGVFLGISAVYSNANVLTPTQDGTQLPEWFSGPNSLGAFRATPPAWLLWVAFGLACLGLFLAMRGRRPARWSDPAWSAISAVVVGAGVAILVFVVNLPKIFDDTSWLIALVVAVATTLWILVGFTTFGRYLRATGENAVAARLAGVNADRITIQAFVIGGLLAALAGILLAATLGSATPGVATPFLLPAFAAAFLSTVLFSSGQFTVWGTIAGGIILVWVAQGLIVGGLNFTWTDVVNGLVLVGAVSLSSISHRRA